MVAAELKAKPVSMAASLYSGCGSTGLALGLLKLCGSLDEEQD